MLINTIAFEIRNFNDGSFSEHLIENTLENQEKVFAHRFTRCIKFTQTFSFQFEREMSMPIEFIEMDTWVRMFEMYPATMKSLKNELDIEAWATALPVAA